MLGRGAAQLMVDGILQDHVQMRVGFVQQHHGAAARMEQRQQ